MTLATLRRARLLLILLPLLALGCSEDNPRPVDPTLPGPTPLPPDTQPAKIEYRVTGTLDRAVITYANAVQGTTEITTELPWFASFTSTQQQTFVYLEAEAVPFNEEEGTLLVQIFVNGVLFRESRERGLTPNVIASGEVVR